MYMYDATEQAEDHRMTFRTLFTFLGGHDPSEVRSRDQFAQPLRSPRLHVSRQTTYGHTYTVPPVVDSVVGLGLTGSFVNLVHI